MQETDSTTPAISTTATTSPQEEVEKSSVTTGTPEASTESMTSPLIAVATSTVSTMNTPLAGYRESVEELDKPDLSRIYRKLFPYLNSDRN
ncbi:hypothetical protein OSTOST_22568 [Ostertagia ostertagi]